MNRAYSYLYDSIGNRIDSEECDLNRTYTVNQLNQYAVINDFASYFHVAGNQTNLLTSTGVWMVQYNAENRPAKWMQGKKEVTMVYDRNGRRVACRSSERDEQSELKVIRQSYFVYYGYLCIQEMVQLVGGALNDEDISEFVWDPTDEIATRPLKWIQKGLTHFYCHDGNKNVSDVVNAEKNTFTHYEYTPFGSVSYITHTVVTPVKNPFRFSSEYHDDQLTLVYYNYRHYNLRDGRWLSRDSLGEIGERNLYSTISAINVFDNLGLFVFPVMIDPVPLDPLFDEDVMDSLSCYLIRLAIFMGAGVGTFELLGEAGRQIYNTWISGGGTLNRTADDFDPVYTARASEITNILSELRPPPLGRLPCMKPTFG